MYMQTITIMLKYMPHKFSVFSKGAYNVFLVFNIDNSNFTALYGNEFHRNWLIYFN